MSSSTSRQVRRIRSTPTIIVFNLFCLACNIVNTTTISNCSFTFSTQSQYPSRILQCIVNIRRKAIFRNQDTSSIGTSSLENSSSRSADKGRARNGTTCPGPTRRWCYTSRVSQLWIQCLYTADHSVFHSQLHSQRPALLDVPAVYFVSPTLANIRRIAEDLEKSLYESFHLNFVEPLPRALLEELAASVARDGTGELVQEV